MQDRFKFRVWLKYAKTMYDISSFCYLNGLKKCVFHFENGSQKTLKIKDFEVTQSTGLKDKNGKLIYEGDIVKLACNREDKGGLFYRNAKIIYDLVDTYSGFCVQFLDDNKSASLWRSQKMEIIGNIYENPELLEGN